MFGLLSTSISRLDVKYKYFPNFRNRLCKFTKYTEWPASERNGDFVIGVGDSKEMYSELVNYTKGEKVIIQDIKVKYFDV